MPVYLLAWTAGLVIVFNTSFGKIDWFVWLLSVGTLVVMHYGIKAEERTKRDARFAGNGPPHPRAAAGPIGAAGHHDRDRGRRGGDSQVASEEVRKEMPQ